MKKERDSNFELLRIVSMLLIIMHHYAVYGFYSFGDVFSGNRLIVQFLWMGGKIGVNCFVLISGYFLCQQEHFRWKSILKFFLQMTFFSAAIHLFFRWGKIYSFQPWDLFNSFFPYLQNIWWFANTYLIFLFIVPFLAKAVKRMTRQEHFWLIVILTVLWCVLPTLLCLWMRTQFECGNLLWFMYLFLVASYIRFYHSERKENRRLIWLYIGIIALMLLLYICFDLLGTKHPLFSQHTYCLSEHYKITVVAASVTLFLIFKNRKPFANPLINKMAAAMFGVYLLHDHYLSRTYIWTKVFKNPDYQYKSILPLHALTTIIMVFLVCTGISMLYAYFIDRPFGKLLDIYGAKAEKKGRKRKESIEKRFHLGDKK